MLSNFDSWEIKSASKELHCNNFIILDFNEGFYVSEGITAVLGVCKETLNVF